MLGKWTAALLVACAIFAPSAGWARPPAVQIQDDKFSSEVTFLGPSQDRIPFGGTFRTWRLRSWVDKTTHAVRHQLYVNIDYDGSWRFYESAADEHAIDLKVVDIDRSVSTCSFGCSFTETVGVMLSDDALKAGVASGFEIKLSAHSGDTLILPISAQQIALQLVAIDTYLGVQNSPYAAALATPAAIPAATPTIAPAAALFSGGVDLSTTKAAPQVMATAREMLVADGYTLRPGQEPDVLITDFRPMKLTTKMADCGRKLGIPYLVDGRAKPRVAFRLESHSGVVHLSAAVATTYKVGLGNPDEELTCTSKGILEQSLATRITAAP